LNWEQIGSSGNRLPNPDLGERGNPPLPSSVLVNPVSDVPAAHRSTTGADVQPGRLIRRPALLKLSDDWASWRVTHTGGDEPALRLRMELVPRPL
jgi:hypothetical protein